MVSLLKVLKVRQKKVIILTGTQLAKSASHYPLTLNGFPKSFVKFILY